MLKTKLSQLLDNLTEVYQLSDINKYCLREGHKWAYSLISGPCVTSSPLLIGFNWGASKGETYEPQTIIEENQWANEKELGSMARVIPYLRKYFSEIEINNISQTNYCFFRSKIENQINSDDLQRCQPLFDQLINLLHPSAVICLSSQLRNFLISTKKVDQIEGHPIMYSRGKLPIKYVAMKGKLDTGIQVYFLPHPNYPLTRIARNAAWDFCFGNR